MITIFHNSRCPYCREALYFVQKICKRDDRLLEIIDYRLTMPQLSALQKKLGKAGGQIIRINDAKYKKMNLSGVRNAVMLQAIVDNPHLLQRPIVAFQNRAVMARPADLVDTLF